MWALLLFTVPWEFLVYDPTNSSSCPKFTPSLSLFSLKATLLFCIVMLI
ncbi:hypothetical protein XSR1_40140 [Xenorhabdus szentirmaii DSM 16338]|uniref:Uncharacterized protein n=1 Tax=Xenorhabdus szentirmaii DSM 16338 TaxID=1427518 RepID=W1J3T2_9GAMM|nr:hypothetical protein XSR1_40140 [Xenorhabdus szentirmaii DSM 16338]